MEVSLKKSLYKELNIFMQHLKIFSVSFCQAADFSIRIDISHPVEWPSVLCYYHRFMRRCEYKWCTKSSNKLHPNPQSTPPCHMFPVFMVCYHQHNRCSTVLNYWIKWNNQLGVKNSPEDMPDVNYDFL